MKTKKILLIIIVLAIIHLLACNKKSDDERIADLAFSETSYSQYYILEDGNNIYCICREESNYIVLLFDKNTNIIDKSEKFSLGMRSARIWLIPGSNYMVESEVLNGNAGWVEVYYSFNQPFSEEYRIYHYGVFDDEGEPKVTPEGIIVTEDYLFIDGQEKRMSEEEINKYKLHNEHNSINISSLDFSNIYGE